MANLSQPIELTTVTGERRTVWPFFLRRAAIEQLRMLAAEDAQLLTEAIREQHVEAVLSLKAVFRSTPQHEGSGIPPAIAEALSALRSVEAIMADLAIAQYDSAELARRVAERSGEDITPKWIHVISPSAMNTHPVIGPSPRVVRAFDGREHTAFHCDRCGVEVREDARGTAALFSFKAAPQEVRAR